MADVEYVCRWAGVVVAGAIPVCVAWRLRTKLYKQAVAGPGATPPNTGGARSPKEELRDGDGEGATRVWSWIRWHGPVVALAVTEALAHLSFITTGHRGLHCACTDAG